VGGIGWVGVQWGGWLISAKDNTQLAHEMWLNAEGKKERVADKVINMLFQIPKRSYIFILFVFLFDLLMFAFGTRISPAYVSQASSLIKNPSPFTSLPSTSLPPPDFPEHLHFRLSK